MTSQEQGKKIQEATARKWARRQARWAAWKVQQAKKQAWHGHNDCGTIHTYKQRTTNKDKQMKRFNVVAKWLNTDTVANHQSVQEDQIDFVNQTFHYNNYFPAQPIQSIENVDTGYLAAFDSYCEQFGTAAE